MRFATSSAIGLLCIALWSGAAVAEGADVQKIDERPAPSTKAMQALLTREERAELFSSIMARVDSDPSEALHQMIALAEAGDTKAQQQVGTFYRTGIGTPVDLAQAKYWYENAIANGRDYALAPLARVEAELGNGEGAYDLLLRAIDAGMPGAERQLGFAHVDKKLGRYSDPTYGQHLLMQLVDGGDNRAARPLLLRYNWNRLPLPAPDRLITRVETDGLEGDGPSAEAALVYLTKTDRYSRGTRIRRQALIDVDGISEKILASERIWLAADVSPNRFFAEADRIIARTPREHFPQAALITARVSQNGYVRILQRELRMLGYYSGRVNGWLTASTIDAHHRFCDDMGILEQCQEGPLRSATIRAVTKEIATFSPFGLK